MDAGRDGLDEWITVVWFLLVSGRPTRSFRSARTTERRPGLVVKQSGGRRSLRGADSDSCNYGGVFHRLRLSVLSRRVKEGGCCIVLHFVVLREWLSIFMKLSRCLSLGVCRVVSVSLLCLALV